MLKGSIVALVTPWTADLEIDEVALRDLAAWHAQSGTDALVVGGTTGESPSLSTDELCQLIEVVYDQVGDKLPIIVGNGSASTHKSITLTKRLNQLPIAAYLTVVPYYVKPTQAGLFDHFTAIADAADRGIILYNVPGRTITDLHDSTSIRLSEHSNIIGIKDATGDLGRLKELQAGISGPFSLLSGDDISAAEFMMLGGHGVISVTANIVPQQMADLCRYCREGDSDRAQTLNAQLADLHDALFVEANPIPVKWLLHRHRGIDNRLRLPMTPLEVGKQQLEDAYLKAVS